MALELPLWSIPIGTSFLSLMFFAPHLNYSVQEWLTGNGLICVLILSIYIIEGIYKKFFKKK